MSRHHTPSADLRIATVDLFAGLSTRQLRRVASLSTPLQRPAGRVIVRQGVWMQELVVIVSGTALATTQGGGAVELSPGDYLGTTDGQRGARHPATVTTTTLTEMLVLSLEDVRALVRDPVIRARLEATQRRSRPRHAGEVATDPRTRQIQPTRSFRRTAPVPVRS